VVIVGRVGESVALRGQVGSRPFGWRAFCFVAQSGVGWKSQKTVKDWARGSKRTVGLSNQRITAFGMNRMFGCQVTNFEQFVRELDT